jgi:hypothetical protein
VRRRCARAPVDVQGMREIPTTPRGAVLAAPAVMRITRHLGMLLALAAGSGPALAGQKAGVTMPDQIEVAGKTLTLNGIGLREATFLGIDVYVAGLYVEHVSSDPAALVSSGEVKRLVMRFVRDVDRGKVVDAWNTGFHHNAIVPPAQIQPQIDRLDAWMRDFRNGDTLAFTYVPGTGVTVEIDGASKGVLPGDDFARSLFAIWLGPRPPTGDLKRDLLGHHTGAR